MEALERVIQCPAITDAWVLGSEDDLAHFRDAVIDRVSHSNARVRCVVHKPRLTFKFFLHDVAGFREGDLCILSNSDCAPDDTMALLAAEPLEGVAVCLSRYDVPKSGDAGAAIMFAENGVSQDAWALRFPFRRVETAADYPLGTPGCDNRFAWQLREAGYKVVNPARTVTLLHFHASDERGPASHRVRGPYLHVKPSRLADCARGADEMLELAN